MLNFKKMKYTGYGFIIILLSMLIFSCVERIDIELDESYTRLVVDGCDNHRYMAHTVMLSKTTSYYYNQPAPPVTGARVQISDGTDVYSLMKISWNISYRSFCLWCCPGRPIL